MAPCRTPAAGQMRLHRSQRPPRHRARARCSKQAGQRSPSETSVHTPPSRRCYTSSRPSSLPAPQIHSDHFQAQMHKDVHQHPAGSHADSACHRPQGRLRAPQHCFVRKSLLSALVQAHSGHVAFCCLVGRVLETVEQAVLVGRGSQLAVNCAAVAPPPAGHDPSYLVVCQG